MPIPSYRPHVPDATVSASAVCAATALSGPLPAPANGPTLLPTSVASLVSLFSKSTSLSIRLGSFVTSTVLESARAGTITSLELSRAAVEGIIRRGSSDVVLARGKETDVRHVEGWANKGLEMFNSSISLTELLLSSAFHLGQSTISTVSNVAETSVNTIDSIFGCTETSRAISEIVRLVRKEFKDSSEHDGEVGIKDIIAGLTCFAILQYRTRARYDLTFAADIIWDVVVDADVTNGTTAAEQQDAAEKAGDLVPVEDREKTEFPENFLSHLPENAEISVTTTSTTTSQTTVEVVGTSPPEFTPPPGATIVREGFEHGSDGRLRYRITYETITARQMSRKLRREEDGDIEMVDMRDEPVKQVFELEDEEDAARRRWEGRRLIGEEPRPNKSRPREGKSEANKGKKRTSVGSEKKLRDRDREDYERDREYEREREKRKEKERRADKESKGTIARLREALQPVPSGSRDKKARLSADHSENFAPKKVQASASAQSSPAASRRQSLTSRPGSPDRAYRPRHHRRRASYTSTTSETTISARRNAAGLVLEDFGSATRPPSLYSYNGEPTSRPPSAGLHKVPSIYTLHTSHSSSSLLFSPPSFAQPNSYFPSSSHLLHNCRKYIRFAAASYGAQFMRFLLGSAFSPATHTERRHHLEHEAFSFHTSLPVDTILLSSHYDPSGGFDSAGHTGTGRPLVHFVCVDHENQSIVVTCRGTLGLEDVLTDLTCEYTNLDLRGSTYRVHKGMYNSAVLLLRSRLLNTLSTALTNYPTYGLVLTGHSLGGGVAALVSILISTPDPSGRFTTHHPALPPARRVHCYAYGPPAAVCEPLRRATTPLITTIVNGLDVVPSLSIGMIRDLHSLSLSLREDSRQPASSSTNVLGELRRRFLAGFWRRDQHEEEFSWELAVLKTLRAGMTAEKLVPPGEVWACRRTERGGKMRVTAGVVQGVEERFGEVRLARGCFGDHSPAEYEKTLEALVRGVLGDEGKL